MGGAGCGVWEQLFQSPTIAFEIVSMFMQCGGLHMGIGTRGPGKTRRGTAEQAVILVSYTGTELIYLHRKLRACP